MNALSFLLLGCKEPVTLEEGPSARMDFDGEDFFDAPFPSDHRLSQTVDLTGFDNPDEIGLVTQTLALLDGVEAGFSTTAAITFSMEEPLDAGSLPGLSESIEATASVYLIDVDPDSAELGRRFPVVVDFQEDQVPFGADNQLSLLPLQGVPLQPLTRYAAVITRRVSTASETSLVAAIPLQQLLAGETPAGLSQTAAERYRSALEQLDTDEIAALAVFTTADPTAGMTALTDAAPPIVLKEGFAADEVFDEYCVYSATAEVPVYQTGESPYLLEGGGIVFTDGVPILDHTEQARIVITIPRSSQPDDGWPVAVMIRTGGGGDRPLVDRGVQTADGEVVTEGEGPALYFARAGYAGLSIDGPLGGIRNPTGGDEQFLIFNISNPQALRDNLRQSATELTLLPALIETLSLETADCPDTDGQAAFTTDGLALMGHSMGATIAPLALAYAPAFEALILSGAGGSWIENVMPKENPLPVHSLAEAMLGYDSGELTAHDPFLSLLQWAGEAADPPIYGEMIRASSHHLLMHQGIVDTYILPPIANTMSLSMGLDLAGAALDADLEYTPLSAVLPLVEGTTLDLPVSGNQGEKTAIVIQHYEDGVQDGHEVMFQNDAPKHQYRCFLESLKIGVPAVPVGGSAEDPC